MSPFWSNLKLCHPLRNVLIDSYNPLLYGYDIMYSIDLKIYIHFMENGWSVFRVVSKFGWGQIQKIFKISIIPLSIAWNVRTWALYLVRFWQVMLSERNRKDTTRNTFLHLSQQQIHLDWRCCICLVKIFTNFDPNRGAQNLQKFLNFNCFCRLIHCARRSVWCMSLALV